MSGAVILPDSYGFASSFGLNNTTLGPTFRARWICSNERYRELDRRQSYYDCTQHDWKQYDFDGRICRPGPPTQQPLLVTEASGTYVPLKARRPSNPYRLARIIVSAFTNLVFGQGRFPQVRIAGDADTQDFLQCLCKVSSLSVRMVQARNIGGAVGSVGLSWCFYNGAPRVSVHYPKHLHVHDWEDRELLVPKHVSEVYYYPDDVFDVAKNKYVRKWFWYRRDWTTEADITFQRIEFKGDKDPVWTIDETSTVRHGDGFCHFVWIQNEPSEDIDGSSDYQGLYENFDSIDTIYSVLTRGTTLNLDPTLVLKMDLDYFQRMGVKKGSDNALCVGESGDASYLELSGQSSQTGIDLFMSMRQSTLEVAQCVITDPDKVTASGVSSVALKVIYASMLSRCDMFRDQYGEGLRRLLDQMVRAARTRIGMTTPEGAQLQLTLPKRAEERQLIGSDGEPTEETEIVMIDRKLGSGGYIDLVWGVYFEPTADDQTKTVTTLSLATGGKAFLSKRSATEMAAAAFALNAEEEVRRVDMQSKIDKVAMQAAMEDADIGGKVGAPNELPPGALERRPQNLPGIGDKPKTETDSGVAV